MCTLTRGLTSRLFIHLSVVRTGWPLWREAAVVFSSLCCRGSVSQCFLEGKMLSLLTPKYISLLLPPFVLSVMLRYSFLSYGSWVSGQALILFTFIVPSDLTCFLAPRCPQIFVNALLPVLLEEPLPWPPGPSLPFGQMLRHQLAFLGNLISPRTRRLFPLALPTTGATVFIPALTEFFSFFFF